MLNFDPQGLVPVVIQDESNGQVLMVAFMNAEALRLTRSTGYTHLFSRSRNTIWRKGEQSGNVQEVRGIYVNCEENSLLLQVVQHGAGACHTGHRSCYYRRLQDDDSYETVEEQVFDPSITYASPPAESHATVSAEELTHLETDMRQLFSAYIYLRDHDMSQESNTSRLLQEQSIEYLAARLGDELQELADVQAGTHVHTGRQDDTILEASQVGYWLMLLAAARNIPYDEVRPHEAILRGYATPGHETLEQAQECLNLLISEKREEQIAGLVMGFITIGRNCAEAGVSPLAPAEYDMNQMRRKGLVGS
ncbi:MAG TPA: phosphoribosyl-AMP cyclohydrolase [Ktedonobacteraceae bacterium]|nr:phosphoribosyl-AMP cyclohydrolase [Ktedonobacteraceae bacterium]